MTTIRIDLPDATARAAREAGLLTPLAMDRLLNDALARRRAGGALLAIPIALPRPGSPP